MGVGIRHTSFGTNAAQKASDGDHVSPYGAHQAGIATPPPRYLYFAAFDLTSSARDDLRGVLADWSAVGASLARGEAVAGDSRTQDTGEAVDLAAVRLTITIGVGPGIFRPDRFGLLRLAPPELRPLPQFQGEDLDLKRSDGDLCLQACADDPQVAFHAIHELARLASGAATLRWGQEGFARTSSANREEASPRNLIGFKDGTDNISAEDAAAMNKFVWTGQGDGPSWTDGGSYLITRRIRILFDVWDARTIQDQERTIGRAKRTGAPLGARHEDDPIRLDATDASGELAIPSDAHIRLAHPQNNAGQRLLRRGYSYSNGVEPGTGEIDAGLFFIAFQRSPARQFIPIQARLARGDALSRHTLHTGSGIFFCPPGTRPGGYVGERLFA